MYEIPSLTQAMLTGLFSAARQNPRRRVMHCFSRHEVSVQRMVNVMQPGAYPRPHWHPRPGNKELVVVLRGSIGLFIFDGADGRILQALRLDPHNRPVADIPTGAWHTFLPLEPDTAVFETKTGPWSAEDDKEFAPWAPAEDSPAAETYRAHLIAQL